MTWVIRGNQVGESENQILARLDSGNDAEEWVRDHGSDFENLVIHNDIVLTAIIEEKK